jgi:hypothetical protein
VELPDFTPPSFKPPKIPEWATYIPKRSPKFKAHNDRGKAINAVNYDKREGWLYRLFDGEWIPWAYKPTATSYREKLILPPERKCECGKEIIDPKDYMCKECRKLL